MNVATQYNTEAKFYAAIGAPMHATPPVALSEIERLNLGRDNIENEMSYNHTRRHELNMAAWRTLYQEAHDRGDHEVANNILTMKLIPNIS